MDFATAPLTRVALPSALYLNSAGRIRMSVSLGVAATFACTFHSGAVGSECLHSVGLLMFEAEMAASRLLVDSSG